MAFHFDMAGITALSRQAQQESVPARARQFVLFVREVRDRANEIITLMDAGALEARRLAEIQNTLAQVRDFIGNWQHGSLIDAAVRQQIANTWPTQYPNPGAVQREMQDVRAAFVTLIRAVQAAIAPVRASRQLFDVDPVTGLTSSPLINDAALRAAAVRFRDVETSVT